MEFLELILLLLQAQSDGAKFELGQLALVNFEVLFNAISLQFEELLFFLSLFVIHFINAGSPHKLLVHSLYFEVDSVDTICEEGVSRFQIFHHVSEVL